MAKKHSKTTKKTEVKKEQPCEQQSITFGQAVLDIRIALVEVAKMSAERYLGVIQKLQELESRMDKLEIAITQISLPKTVKEDSLPASFDAAINGHIKPLPTALLNKQTETSDALDDI